MNPFSFYCPIVVGVVLSVDGGVVVVVVVGGIIVVVGDGIRTVVTVVEVILGLIVAVV